MKIAHRQSAKRRDRKRSILSIIGILSIYVAFGQSQRMVLAEDLSSASCPPSVPANIYFNNLINANASKVIKVTYPFGYSIDPMYNQDAGELGPRCAFYQVPYVPYALMDGTLPDTVAGSFAGAPYNWTQTKIDSAYAIPSPFSITLFHSFNQTMDTVFVNAIIVCTQNCIMSKPVFQCVMLEDHIHFTTAPGTNGEKDFYDVARKFIPGVSGTVIDSIWTAGQIKTLNFAQKIPYYIYNKSQIAIAGFIQDNANKDVKQAGYSAPFPVKLDAGIIGIGGIPVYSCSTVVTPSTLLKNFGSDTLTSCILNYKLDNGTVQTQNWVGSLSTGDFIYVNLAQQTVAAGSHTFVVYCSNPNGQADENTVNDQTTMQFNNLTPWINTLPFVEGFTNAPFPYTGWSVLNPDTATTWARAYTGGFGNSVGCLKMDFFNYQYHLKEKDFVYLPSFDLSAYMQNLFLKFSLAYAQFDSTYKDSLDVEYSLDCGNTWNSAYSKTGSVLATTHPYNSAFTPSATEWRIETVNLSACIGQSNVILRFKAVNGFGNNLYLDDINLWLYSVDVNELTANSKVNLFPNPFSETTVLEIGDNELAKNCDLVLYDISGRQVRTSKITEKKMIIAKGELKSGIYFYRVVTAGNVFAQGKFVIE